GGRATPEPPGTGKFFRQIPPRARETPRVARPESAKGVGEQPRPSRTQGVPPRQCPQRTDLFRMANFVADGCPLGFLPRSGRTTQPRVARRTRGTAAPLPPSTLKGLDKTANPAARSRIKAPPRPVEPFQGSGEEPRSRPPGA